MEYGYGYAHNDAFKNILNNFWKIVKKDKKTFCRS